jgi:cytochrome c oxidase cbb3-type subunit I/II
LTQQLDTNAVIPRMVGMRKIGVPYSENDITNAQQNLAIQEAKIVTNLQIGAISNAPPNSEIVAVIAYLQRLGTDIKAQPAQATTATTSK